MHWIDPLSLPETSGTVARFLYNVHGDTDGFLLADGTQVHFPPHLSSELLKEVEVGDKVSVRGVKPRGAQVIAAVALRGKNGLEITDEGPDAKPARHSKERVGKPVEVHAQVQRTLYAPKGEVCGAILVSGEIVRMRPKENAALAPYFESGAKIALWGDAIVVRGQKVIDLGEVAFDE
jgi:hypothetical protein